MGSIRTARCGLGLMAIGLSGVPNGPIGAYTAVAMASSSVVGLVAATTPEPLLSLVLCGHGFNICPATVGSDLALFTFHVLVEYFKVMRQTCQPA